MAQFDLLLAVTQSEQGLNGTWSYSSDLFDKTTIERMSKHLVRLLEEIVNETEQPVGELPLMTAEEVEQLIEWNETAREWSAYTGVHELFAAQAEQTPAAPALIYEDEQLSYNELNVRANQLAHYLKELKVGAETIVGLCVERGLELVVGMLGVLKAGGAYLPIDPAYPRERISFMLENAGATVLLTQERLSGVLPAHRGQTIYLDSQWDHIATRDSANLETEVSDQNAVYLIYTSGTTGQPKGVLIPHRALLERTRAMIDVYQLSAADRMIQFVSPSFDAFAEELFPILSCGATLVLTANPDLLEVTTLLRLVDRLQVTTLHMTASYFHQIVEHLQDSRAEMPRSIRLLIAGGESASPERVASWIEFGEERTRFAVAYGPTEATITATVHAAPEQADAVRALARLPIGRPLANTGVYILDQRMELLPAGVTGELYIGGIGLARGYVGLPQSTAERFIPNPHSSEPGARLYRTGDLGRYLANGEIEFLGRADEQVKIRGFRIELGEVEAVLSRHAGVRECVVVAREDVPGDKRLVGYVVELQPVEVSDLRAHLRASLPDYMVPSAIVILDELPLNTHGKIDRRALPSPQEVFGKADADSTLTPIEEMLAAIWLEVLPVTHVSAQENFFELGGHSLLATQVVSRIREVFSIELPLRGLFEAPVLSDLAAQVETRMRAAAGMPTPPLVRADRGVEAVVSFAQQRLWFIDQLEPNNPLYNNPLAVRLSGELKKGALERTLTEIVRRHEVLRTTFRTTNGEPVQVVTAPTRIRLPEVDLSELDVVEQEATAHRLAQQEAVEAFDLSCGPLLRVKLLRLKPREHVVLLTMHHIIADGWSMGVFINEVATLYRAYYEGRESPLPELEVQYADVAIWQRDWLQGEALERQLRYWEEQLRGAATLELPVDRPRAPLRRHRGATHSFTLGAELSEALAQLSRREGSTLFMTVLAAFQSLLSRYCGQSDIVVGTDIANRHHRELEPLIGFFVNQLVLRTQVNAGDTFRELLARVKEVCLGAYAHQDVPFEKLVEELQPQRDLSRTPLFQVKLSVQNAQGGGVELPGLTLSGISDEAAMARFDLLLSLTNTDHGLTGSWAYCTDLFDRVTMARMSAHFVRVLEAVTANAETAVADLPLLSPEEQAQMLVEWNETKQPHAADKFVPQLFEEQVLRTPEAVAVTFGDEQISYRELNQRANQLAHYLREFGVGPEMIVGICADRSLEMVIGLLGILKAGGAYLPLDPNYPAARISFMLEDAGVEVVVTQKKLSEKLLEYWGQTIFLDAEWEEMANYSTENLLPLVTGEHLAYLMYTSGSTGQPKGVLVEHRSLSNYLSWATDFYRTNELRQSPLHSSISFDLSVTSLYPALLSGGVVSLVSEGSELESLSRFLGESEPARVKLTPSHLRALGVGKDEPEGFGAGHVLVLGGESLSSQNVRWWREGRVPGRLINEYGPTEAVVGCCVHEVAAGEDEHREVLIGRPIWNTQMYVLGKAQELLPVGAIGELYIGGAGLARGYLGRPEHTAESFIPHPYSTEAGTRLYRTGDRGRYLATGEIEYLGRADEQVKIRGYRIELGEVEAALSRHPAVRECVVVAHEDRLVGYVVAATTVNELREHLRAQLPEYMVPSVIVLLERLPLTANGKLDRSALPVPDPAGALVTTTFVAPRTELERAISAIWQTVLGREKVGINDNFFDLGGHSLLLVKVYAQLRAELGVELQMLKLFEYPTVGSLAAFLSGETQEEQTPAVDDDARVELRKEGMKQRRKARTEHRILSEVQEVSGD